MSDQGESHRKESGKFRFAIDRGGTFTDVYSECPNGEVRVMKLLSVDPAYPDAPREGIRRILEQVKQLLFVVKKKRNHEPLNCTRKPACEKKLCQSSELF